MNSLENNKTLLVLSGGLEAVEGIRVARQMGLNVIVCDRNPAAPGRMLADWFICADIYNPIDVTSKVLHFSRYHNIDGVITIASDAVRSVAELTELLRLQGVSKATAFVTTDKLVMKKVLAENGIPVPRFAGVDYIEELPQLIKKFGRAVLKPVDSRGARGVVRVSHGDDPKEAFFKSIKHSPSGRLILEEWLDGPQLSAEAIVVDGRLYLCGVADRNYARLEETYPYVIEDGGETPSRFSPQIDQKLTALLQDVAEAIELTHGVLKADIVVVDGEPYIIEVASRLSGGFFSTLTIPLVYGINIISMAILIALGMEVEPPKGLKPISYQANRFFFCPAGVVTKISAPAAEELPDYVKYFNIGVKEGDHLEPITDHTKRRGSVLVCGESREQAIERAEEIVKRVSIEVDSHSPVTDLCEV